MEWFALAVEGAPVAVPVDIVIGHVAAAVAVLTAVVPLLLAVRGSRRTADAPVQVLRLRALEGGRELRRDAA